MDLSIEHLSVSLGRRPVLRDVSAILRPGRITAILGPNGAGKSTLVKAAVGLIAPGEGVIRLGDDRIDSLDPRARARKIGYLPQDSIVHWNIVARDVVALGRLPHRSPHAAPSPADHAAIDAALAATETAAFADRPIRELSGGERGRVLLARVLAGDPEWLIADEPLASLDPAHQIDMLGVLAAFAARGRGVAIVLHDLVHAQRAADDVLVLANGRVAAFGPIAEVLTPTLIGEVFDVAVTAVPQAGGRPIWIPIGRLRP